MMNKLKKTCFLLTVLMALSNQILFAANDYVTETFVIDGISQPPLVGSIIKSGDVSKITSKGFIVTTDKANYAYETAIKTSVQDTPVECSSFDCTGIKGDEFSCRIGLLKGNTQYYVYSYIITDDSIHYSNAVTLTSGDFNRCPQANGYANVWYAFSYTLFGWAGDEIIDPSVDGFYYSTNENPDYVGYQKGTSYNTCYKFRSKWNYMLWRHGSEAPSIPEFSLSNKKLTMTTDDNCSIYYSKNGDGLKPENFTSKYSEPIDIEYGDVVYAYSINEDLGYPSYTVAYKAFEDIDNGKNKFIQGSGTKDDPFLIGNKEQLKWFMDTITIKNDLCARLTDDIVLNKNVLDDNYNLNGDGSDFEQWNCHQFCGGVFNGGGHTISGIYINGSSEYVGLFSNIDGCTIDSLGVIDSYITGYRHVGGITSWNASGSTISNCYFEGVVKASQDKAGGIAAHMGNTQTHPLNKIVNCYNKGKISGYNHVGGICGSAFSLTSTNSDYIENCYNVGTVSATSTDCGAICGYADNAYGSKVSAAASHCYYLDGSCTKIGQGYMGESKSLEEFNDGTVCTLLNNNGGKFIQGKRDLFPLLFKTPVNIEIVDGQTFDNSEESIYDTISYIRTFNTTKWQALYIPFSMSYDDWKGDYDIARINDAHQYDDNDDGTIDRTEIEVIKVKSGNIEPNTPYLIKAKVSGDKVISVSDATLYKSEENSFDVTSWNTKFTFTGTYSGIDGQTMLDNGYYAMGNSGALVQAKSASSNLGTFRWYLSVTDRNGNKKNVNSAKISVFCLDDDEATGISSLDSAEKNSNTKIYDLTGRYVGESKAELKIGVYIQNGKKFNVK